MTSLPADLARRVAQRLAAETDPNLPALTERVLAEGPRAPGGGMTSRSFDPAVTIALAALVVSAAQFAWTAYRDLKKDRQEAWKEEAAEVRRELLLRRLRLAMADSPGISRDRRDRVLEVVVEEVLTGGSDD